MIVELYGLPASGKTTLARELVRRAGFRIIKIRSRKELLFYNLVFLVRHPIKFFGLFWQVVKNAGSLRLFYHKLMNCFLHPNGRLIKASRFKKAIVDQGHWQNLLALFERPLAKSDIKNYFRFMLQPDCLVVLEIDEQTLFRRVEERGYFAREWQGKKYVDKWQEILIVNDKTVRQVISSLPIKYCLVDGRQEKEIVFKKIQKYLNE
jgi:adenylate kinase family enzyme